MILVEEKYSATRGKTTDDYQTLEVVREAPQGKDPRRYIRFCLMESRWRSPQEAADYLRWAAERILNLEVKS